MIRARPRLRGCGRGPSAASASAFRRVIAPAAGLVSLAGAASAEPPSLSLPVDCELGETCYVQKHVDRDPGPGFVDVGCGALGEDGHNGTDVALPSIRAMQAGVEVLAAAPGVVLGLRDGMPDISITDPAAPDIGGRLCGNVVSLDHGDGWTTQYCHLALGSLMVELGETVERGRPIGRIGMSGSTEFPHVHMTLRHGDEVVDPFDTVDGRCGDEPREALWAEPMPYVATGIISAGVLDRLPEYDEVQAGLGPHPGHAGAPLVLWAYAFGARPGDAMRFVLAGPDGTEIDAHRELDRRQVAYFRANGRHAPEGGWTPGPYEGRIEILRDGEVMDAAPVEARIE